MSEFKCPKCEALSNQHGKGGAERCRENLRSMSYGPDCLGLICECGVEDCPRSEEDDHGIALSNPCEGAHCYHCGWEGTVPVKPKGLLPWEKKALEAGWTMPAARQKELLALPERDES